MRVWVCVGVTQVGKDADVGATIARRDVRGDKVLWLYKDSLEATSFVKDGVQKSCSFRALKAVTPVHAHTHMHTCTCANACLVTYTHSNSLSLHARRHVTYVVCVCMCVCVYVCFTISSVDSQVDRSARFKQITVTIPSAEKREGED